ncbi:hypothetical protein A33Q_4687 [Indibacter alkaliphilus LW1]|uniref:Uncharacterized protein n=1 Tax=Indibacter alkaliphilus (strain CCUG 57479 / KCTC 22604 / LW1) TaxID=1189612 RepID=S2DN99_INDAL|nr:hypothetical protein [Indibacter alkaliphilus]EOZ91298.1 hypothetical protein A33Q_4687 [Indibacter alkaliphilus LW1]
MSLFRHICLLFFTVIFFFPKEVFGQRIAYSVPSDEEMLEYVERMKSIKYDGFGVLGKFLLRFPDADSSSYYSLVKKIEELGPTNDPGFQMRLLSLKAQGVTNTNSRSEVLADSLMSEMLTIAKKSGDIQLIAEATWNEGTLHTNFSNYDQSMFKCLEALEIFENQLPSEYLYEYYYFLSQLSFIVQDYDNTIQFAKLALGNDVRLDTVDRIYQARFVNAIGQAYLKKGMLEEAEQYMLASKEQSKRYNSVIWVGINDCFLGQVYVQQGRLDEAKKMLLNAVDKSNGIDKNINGYAKAWLGRLYWLEKNLDSAGYYLEASRQVLEEFDHKMRFQNKSYLTDLYLFKADYFKSIGDQKEGDFHFAKFKNLNDSIQTMAILSSKNIAMLRLENERAGLALQLSESEKSRIVLRDNLLIGSIFIISVIFIGWFNMRNKRLKLEKQVVLAEAEKLNAEKLAAIKQLNRLKKNLMEKTELLSQFEAKLIEVENTVTVQEDLDKINHLKIVTEDDWQEFKELFDKIYPGFRMKLRKMSPDITTAELRLATLIKLQYTAKEMAAVLGVSADSIYKTRYRLRSRLSLPNESSLEAFISEKI